MDLNCCISKDLNQVIQKLTALNIPYTIKEIDTFKLNTFDSKAVIGYKVNDDGKVLLYVCKFKCEVN